MATVITSECINCGACEPECPNTAIYQGGVEWEFNGAMHPAISQDIFYIVPDKCTECVGFFDQEACAAVCPVDCCVPDPARPETEAALLARAKELHPGEAFPDDFPSRFRKDGAATPAAEAAGAAPAAAPVAAVAAAPAAPAAAKAPVAAPGRTERPLSPPKPAPIPAAPMKEKPIQGELPGAYEDALAALGTVKSNVSPAMKWFLMFVQPLLGALPYAKKKEIEDAVGDPRFFTAASATGANVLQNFILYPLLISAFGALTMDRHVFSSQMNSLIILGVGIAALEAVLRMREGVLHALPLDQVVYRGTWYGAPLVPLASLLTGRLQRVQQQGSIAVDGFHGGNFADKLERERRYGEVYTLKEVGNGYILRLEFPRTVPQSAKKEELGVPDEMPGYDYDLALRNGFLVVSGRVTDTNVRKLAAVSPAFPPDFTTNVELPAPVRAFKHRIDGKTLEVVLLKS